MRLALFTFLLSLCTAVSALAAELNDIRVEQVADKDGVEVHLFGDRFTQDTVRIFEIEGNQPRIVIDFSNASSRLLRAGNLSRKHNGLILEIRGAVRNNSDIRVVLDLKPGIRLVDQDIRTDRVIISVKDNLEPAQAEITMASSTSYIGVNRDIPTPRIKPKIAIKPVIVIDAGHGGRDPGALGGLGLREKKVTLAAALELKRQLLATGRYRVVLTRGDDRYIEHEDRLRLARANSADLFISLHADATVGKSARGASVYTLADRARNRSKRIVDSQNWIMDVNLSEQTDKVGDILVDLAQRDTFTQSTKFADLLIQELGQSTKLLRNSHRRAGYYVLLAPDVPAVLLELGFISNPADEKLLKSESHRRKLMTSVVSAINQYFDR